MRLLEYIKADICRYYPADQVEKGIPLWAMLSKVFIQEELWALISYRFGRWIICNINYKWIRKFIILLWSIPNRIIRILSGNIIIFLSSDIGKGLYLHYGPIVINAEKVGEYCNFSIMDVIGYGGRGSKYGRPVIGDRVFIGPGAVVTGKISIGNDVAIGANSVVNKDIPDHCLVAGVPANIIDRSGSDQLIEIRRD